MYLVEDYIDYLVYVLEYLKENVWKGGKVEKVVVLVDMGNQWFPDLNFVAIEKFWCILVENYP